MNYRLLFLLMAVCFFSPGCKEKRTAYYPDDEWRTATPEEVGIRPENLEAALEYLTSKSFRDGISEVMLIKDGYLILQKGKWENKQLIPANWIAEATRNQVPVSIEIADTDRKRTDGRGNYGYNWWTKGIFADGNAVMPDTPDGTAYMSGLNNNLCFIIPGWNMVFVRMGVDGNLPEGKPYVYNEFFRILMENYEEYL